MMTLQELEEIRDALILADRGYAVTANALHIVYREIDQMRRINFYPHRGRIPHES